MDDSLIFSAFGGSLVAVGLLLIVQHVRSHRRRQTETGLSDQDRDFYRRQYSRRLQTSALAVLLGALIALCSHLEFFTRSPLAATVYVAAMLILAFWLMLLGIGDAVASRMHFNRTSRRLRTEQANLDDALAQVRSAYGLENPNGSAETTSD